jgi:hypothetical protein
MTQNWRASVIARGEYEYQMWHAIFGPHDLTPQGFTFGVVYDLGKIQR